jgi:hypothetical protein
MHVTKRYFSSYKKLHRLKQLDGKGNVCGQKLSPAVQPTDWAKEEAREIWNSVNILTTSNQSDDQERLQKKASNDLIQMEHFVSVVDLQRRVSHEWAHKA